MKQTTIRVHLQDDTTFDVTMSTETEITMDEVISFLASRQGLVANGNEIWTYAMVKKYEVVTLNGG